MNILYVNRILIRGVVDFFINLKIIMFFMYECFILFYLFNKCLVLFVCLYVFLVVKYVSKYCNIDFIVSIIIGRKGFFFKIINI